MARARRGSGCNRARLGSNFRQVERRCGSRGRGRLESSGHNLRPGWGKRRPRIELAAFVAQASVLPRRGAAMTQHLAVRHLAGNLWAVQQAGRRGSNRQGQEYDRKDGGDFGTQCHELELSLARQFWLGCDGNHIPMWRVSRERNSSQQLPAQASFQGGGLPDWGQGRRRGPPQWCWPGPTGPRAFAGKSHHAAPRLRGPDPNIPT